MNELTIRNRHRSRRVNLTLLRQITKALLNDLLAVRQYELGIHLIAAPEMTLLNETFLQHTGSTDVITFDNSEPETRNLKPESLLAGEIFICLDDAIKQARQFRTTWQSELTRYVIHGILHLLGHDDLNPAARRKMKREENRLLREITESFPLSKLHRSSS
jgi:probable rRNA maturation factor